MMKLTDSIQYITESLPPSEDHPVPPLRLFLLLLLWKTGMGKVEDVAVDAWFTGFAETAEGKRYFCVYLGRTDGREVSSTLAREIAIRIL